MSRNSTYEAEIELGDVLWYVTVETHASYYRGCRASMAGPEEPAGWTVECGNIIAIARVRNNVRVEYWVPANTGLAGFFEDWLENEWPRIEEELATELAEQDRDNRD